MYSLLTTEDQVRSACEKLSRFDTLGFDVETTSLAPRKGKLRLIQLSSETDNYILDIFQLDNQIPTPVKNILEGPTIKIIHNAKFEWQWCKANGIELQNIFDTYLADIMICAADVGMYMKHGLGEVVPRYLDFEMDKDLQKSDWSHTLSDAQLTYAAKDSECMLPLRKKLIQRIVQFGLEKIAKLEFAAIPAVGSIELYGFPVDADMYARLCEDLERRRIIAAKKLQELVRATNSNTHVQESLFEDIKEKDFYAVNLNSPIQIKQAFKSLGVPIFMAPTIKDGVITKKNDLDLINEYKRKGKYCTTSTQEKELKPLLNAFPKLQFLINHREAEKLCSSYGFPLLEKIDNGRLYPSLWQIKGETGRTAMSDPNLQQCFPGFVEILTKRGWVRFDCLNKTTDTVAQFYSNTNQIDFTTPTGWVKQNYCGDLINNFTEEQIDIISTSDHECLLQNRKTGEFVKVIAENYKPDYQQKQAGIGYFDGETLKPTQITLMCALQADGHITPSKAIDFIFQKKRKTKRLVHALINLNIPYYLRKKGTQDRISIRKNDVPSWLLDKKFFGDWLLKYSSEVLQLFSKEVLFWDGLWTRKSLYTSKYKSNVDWVQIMFLLSNRRARVASRMVNGKPYWDTWIAKNSYSLTTNFVQKRIKFSGLVYCVTVPSGNIIIRNNNKVAIVGNCPIAPEFRNCFTAPEGKKLVIADYGQIELRVLAQLSQDPVLLKVFREGLDLHSMTQAGIYGQTYEYVQEHKKELKDERVFAKTLNFGISFGMGAGSYSQRTGKSIKEAKADILKFKQTYPGMNNWLETSGRKALASLSSKTLWGRGIKFNRPYGPTDEEKNAQEGAVMRNGKNHPIQGSAADIAKLGLKEVYDAIQPYDARIVHFVHDEVHVECNEEDAPMISKLTHGALVRAGEKIITSVPVIVDVIATNSWAEKL